MPSIASPGDGVIFMKVGTHAAESLEDILERKQREIDVAGVSFWGYGGPTCHPLLHVRPFVEQLQSEGHTIYLVMQKMDSRHFAEPKPAEQYSDDGVTWNDIPDGVVVRGSRYALALESLTPHSEDMNFDAMHVGVGRSLGRSARDYIKGRVDKACFVVEQAGEPTGPPLHIDLVAKLKEPYAVLLR